LGVLHPEKIRKMGVLSGFAPDGVEEAITPGLLNGKSIFVAHGALDDTVPISMAEHAIGLLKKAGAQVHYCQSEIGHKLSSACLKAFGSYLMD
jgi:predicted esterase